MITVWKYPFAVWDTVDPWTVRMPIGATVVHVGCDPDRPAHKNGSAAIWAEVDSEETVMADHAFMVVGTGHAVPPTAVHVASWNDGPYMWHLYR